MGPRAALTGNLKSFRGAADAMDAMDAPLQDLPGRGFHCRRCGDAVTPADDAHPIAWCGRCRRVGVAVRVPFTPVVAPAVSPAVTAG